MTDLLTIVAAHKVVSSLLGGVLVTAVAAGGGIAFTSASAVVSAAAQPTQAVVEHVVDGDTVDVRMVDGDRRRVRLLNIDAPESVDPNVPAECLGPEAAQFLSATLPEGAEVILQYDEVREDRYGRDLAAVVHGGRLVNAEIARAGLAQTLVVGGNDRFYDAVESARAEAEAAGVGLYAKDVACTLPAQVAAFESAVAEGLAASPGAGATLDQIDAHGQVLAGLVTAGSALDTVLGMDGLPASRLPETTRRRMAELRDAGLRRVIAAQEAQREARAAEERRLADEAARIAEEQRVAAEHEAARVAAEQEAARAERERLAAANSRPGQNASGPAERDSSPASPERPQPDPPSVPADDGYTGCRAYGSGGTSIDDQGRRFTKIDCTTKVPIG